MNVGKLGAFQEGLCAFGSRARLGGAFCTTGGYQEDGRQTKQELLGCTGSVWPNARLSFKEVPPEFRLQAG